jgi:hypothetical protein
MWDLWWTKWRWGSFSPSTSVSPVLVPPIAPQSPPHVWGWYSRPVMAAVRSGLSLTPLIIINNNNNNNNNNNKKKKKKKKKKGRSIVQAVSPQLLPAAARVRAQVRSCGIRGEQSDTWAGFLLVLRFP